jgi:hypothetical protein
MDNQNTKTRNPTIAFILDNRDVSIVILAFVFSALGYTVNGDFTGIGFTLSSFGFLTALLPMNKGLREDRTTFVKVIGFILILSGALVALLASKKDPQDERTTAIKHTTGYYAYTASIVGLFAAVIITRLLHVSLATERLPFYFLHASLFTFSLLYVVFRRVR